MVVIKPCHTVAYKKEVDVSKGGDLIALVRLAMVRIFQHLRTAQTRDPFPSLGLGLQRLVRQHGYFIVFECI